MQSGKRRNRKMNQKKKKKKKEGKLEKEKRKKNERKRGKRGKGKKNKKKKKKNREGLLQNEQGRFTQEGSCRSTWRRIRSVHASSLLNLVRRYRVSVARRISRDRGPHRS